MRFARHARIFRGPLDPAPVAAVLMLLMLFMLLGSLVYTPGVLVELGPANPTNATITITSSDDIAFAGKTYKPGELDQLRADLKSVPGNTAFSVREESGADKNLALRVSNLFQITLPDGKNLTGTDNATVMVAVNFRGQCFYENRPVQEAELKAELGRRLKNAMRDSKKLTLILQLDKAAENQVQTRLFELAREVGITEVLLAGRPPVFGGQP
jgi:biopolymer transport protein ExbD